MCSTFSVLFPFSLPVFAQLVDRVFDESLNFRKIPPVISANKAPEINGKPVELRPRAPDSLEPRALRRRTWNREEVRSNTEHDIKNVPTWRQSPSDCQNCQTEFLFLCVFRRCWTACCSIQFLSCPARSDTLLTKQQGKSGNYTLCYYNLQLVCSSVFTLCALSVPLCCFVQSKPLWISMCPVVCYFSPGYYLRIRTETGMRLRINCDRRVTYHCWKPPIRYRTQL